MTKKKFNINLASYDDIFSTEESRIEDSLEKVQNIKISELHPFKNHPFKVIDDEEMKKMVQSIQEYGVLSPAIARPRLEGGYELVSGHRRCRASELAGNDTLPVIVRDLDDDEATILMVDANLQREALLPSERAFAYKMKLDALKHQGKRSDLTSGQLGQKSKLSVENVAEMVGTSYKQVQRFIRLTELTPKLLEMVDNKELSFNPAVELSYLSKDEQDNFLEAIEYAQSIPSLSQAQRLKQLSKDGICTCEAMCAVLSEEKKQNAKDQVVFTNSELKELFNDKMFKSYTPKQIKDEMVIAVKKYIKQRNKSIER